MAQSRRRGNHLLRQRREQFQMTQAQLAAMTGVTERTIQAYESEARQPRGRNRSRLMTALGVDNGEQIGFSPSANVYRGPRNRAKETSLREAVAQVAGGRLNLSTSALLRPPDTVRSRVGRADIDGLRASTRDVAGVVGRYGGGILHPDVTARLWRPAARLVHGQVRDELVPERGAAVVEHGITLSWAHTDANAHDRALPFLLASLAVAREAGPASDTLVAWTMGALVRWAILGVRFRDAREVAEEAPAGEQHAEHRPGRKRGGHGVCWVSRVTV